MCTSADPAKRPSMSEEAIASVEGENAASKGGKKQTSPEDSAKQHTQVRIPLSLHQGIDIFCLSWHDSRHCTDALEGEVGCFSCSCSHCCCPGTFAWDKVQSVLHGRNTHGMSDHQKHFVT